MDYLTTFQKTDEETRLQYIWRVCFAKDSGVIDITWEEVANILNQSLVQDETEYLGESAYRKQYQQAKMYFEEVFSKMVSDEYYQQIAEQKRELQIERYKFFDQRNAYNKILRRRARQEEINEIINTAIEKGSLPALNFSDNVYYEHSNNDMLISLTDIHYGANIKNAWNTYNSDVCRERFKKYLSAIIEVQNRHNSENAIVWCNGDEISGSIHNEITVTNKENVIEQIMGVSELISEFLSILSRHFKTVRFVSVAGNHSRIDKKDDALKDERLDDLIEWYCKARLSKIDNILFDTADKIDSTMYLINIRGLNYVGCHGDYDVGKGRILDLQAMIRKPIYAVLYGHMHHNCVDTYQGIKTIMAGTIQGIDNHCIAKRIFGRPEQLLTIVDNAGVVCHYDIGLE